MLFNYVNVIRHKNARLVLIRPTLWMTNVGKIAMLNNVANTITIKIRVNARTPVGGIVMKKY